ncbi:uncharacterized protein M6B38_398820 [Iris pallida]|uniref:Uncharacterized protein n=1 Tax=Iris pallida TaxID=29817 RepID=A0AAX6FUA0_IRIPA|nr:uncharacterized protein M6B38_398820 [Iris pallida]
MSPTSSSLGRSLLLLRHRCDQQVHSMDGQDSSSDPVHLFDRHVSSFLLSLLPASGDQIPGSLLSLSWINHLLRSFSPLLDEFHSLLLSSKLPNRPLLDRYVADFHDRSVKALDLLNAVRDGLGRVRHVGSHLGAAVSAINSGQTLRAGKLLADLSSSLGADAPPPSHRNRSFNRDQHRHRQLRTLSWSVSVSRAWSASRQLQAMGSSLPAPPRPADVSATNGLAVPIFAMSSVLLFVLWVLVAAVPCQQDRGSPHAHVPPPPPPPPRGYAWAAVMASVQEKVLEEAKRRERKGHSGGGGGLMTEMCRVESASRNLTEMMGKERSEGREWEVRELEEAREGIKEGLESAERQVRDLFCRIVRYRTLGLDCLPTRT